MRLPFRITLTTAILAMLISCIFIPIGYSVPNQIYSIPVHVIRVDPVAIDDSQIEEWVNVANDILTPAGIRLVLDSSSEIVDADISSMVAGLSNPGVKSATKEVAKYPDKLVVFFRAGADGNGFSDRIYEFVAMPQFNMTFLCKAILTPAGDCLDTTGMSVDWEQNAGQLAHDIGHYFGLNHTFPGYSDPNYNLMSATQKYVDSGFNVNIFDGDSLSDTQPDPGVGVYVNEGWHLCNADHPSYTIGTVETVTIRPDRNNLMGYFPCDPTLLTPMQVEELRTTLEDRMRSGLASWTIGDDAHVVGVAPDGTVHEFYYIPEAGRWQHSDLTWSPTHAIRFIPRSSLTGWTIGGDEHVAGLERDGTLTEFLYIPERGYWGPSPITRTEGPKLDPGFSLTSWTIGDDAHIAGLTPNGTLHEFYYIPEVGRWQHTDITREANGDKMRSSLISWTIGDDAHIAGLAPDGTLHEFYYIPEVGRWQHTDLFENSGRGEKLKSITGWTIDNNEHIAGLAPDGTLHEFYYISGAGKWQYTGITLRAEGPKLNPSSTLTSWTIGDDAHVAGLLPDGALHEFYYIPEAGSWEHGDMSASAEGPKLNPSSTLTSWTIGDDAHVAGLAPDGSVHEFYFIPDVNHWQHGGITQNADGPNFNPGLQVVYSN